MDAFEGKKSLKKIPSHIFTRQYPAQPPGYLM
jgi:hypothetical protein